MFAKIKQKILGTKKPINASASQAYVFEPGKAQWMNRDYKKFASESYIKNVIAHRAIAMISTAAASVPFTLFNRNRSTSTRLEHHPMIELLQKPNPMQNGKELMEMVYSYRQLSGNVYLLSIHGDKVPTELYALRPDRVSIVSDDTSTVPLGYRYQVGKEVLDFPVDPFSGLSDILHIKTFHPLSDFYGLSSIESAAYSIDQHNQAGEWNQALLQNGARPSGAIIVGNNGGSRNLTDAQYQQLRTMIRDSFAGAKNAGSPLILEGGLEWKEMSLSPKDMDFIASKHSSARDIALALGMPPQLLGIPGDNTYANLQEARLALWEQTIIPMVQNVVEKMHNWLTARYQQNGLVLSYDVENISALAAKRDEMWRRVDSCSFLTLNEKRKMVGLGSIVGGDSI
jgi:HK97 family phage portal protein